ncbi:hypothetical protein [uncultured Jatrophihabitans sp.]|uniref:hypothetical protein n=1 Tax=uncultured Jatrophihabitans sp. TaxID=1610747 RepID=UPI0035C9743E
MFRRIRFALRPGWLVVHVLVLAAAITMIFLGRWQLHVSESKHFDIQNFGYVIQWWLFATFAVAMWLRVLRDAARRQGAGPVDLAAERALAANDEPVAYRRYVMPTTAAPPDDDYRAAYNDYLAGLARNDTERR